MDLQTEHSGTFSTGSQLLDRLQALALRLPGQLGFVLLTALFVAMEFFFAWWAFLIPAFIVGYLIGYHRSHRRAICLAGILSWVGMAVIEDAMTGWRLSPRLSGLVHLPFGVGIYLILALISGLLVALSVNLANGLRIYVRLERRKRIKLQKPSGK